jgi:hypothetical protein
VIIAFERLVKRDVPFDYMGTEGDSSKRNGQTVFVTRIADGTIGESVAVRFHDPQMDLSRWCWIRRRALEDADSVRFTAHDIHGLFYYFHVLHPYIGIFKQTSTFCRRIKRKEARL